jgi:hypothetical protein
MEFLKRHGFNAIRFLFNHDSVLGDAMLEAPNEKVYGVGAVRYWWVAEPLPPPAQVFAIGPPDTPLAAVRRIAQVLFRFSHRIKHRGFADLLILSQRKKQKQKKLK